MQSTVRKLLQYNNEINQLQGSIMFEFFGPKIRQFARDNNIRIQSAYDKIDKLRAEYFELDEKGNAKFTGEGKDKTYIYKEGKTKEEHEAAFNAIMDSETTIKF